ncbi:nucleotidyltransferase [Bacillus sp. Xin]|uniref:nucleotidyltransferase n=1 Tax=unclassified Bacillus (in: firmicutes) TaxID=185979 RepID=UPI001571A3F6|nr:MULTISPECIES: nucleotidyltransferase [unclassified Bacillus (in: firmicutes)]MBC6973000.1 nucleotidyltransferase [Bacillus sp. Xin]NSW37647.1 nucleotidyltransferase [Bacillus sp. Xin1]
MSTIKKIGRFCPVDDTGYIINDSHINNIQPVFLKVIQQVKDICFHLLQDDLHSIYIRGSVPRGIGIEGIADIDTIILVRKAPEEIDLEWSENIEQQLLRKFGCISGVELSFYDVEEVLHSSRFSFISFMIQTHGVCLFGEDIRPQLPKYKVSQELAREHLIHLQSQIEQACGELIHNKGSDDITDCCRWIMKIVVRAGLALTIDKEGLYSRDLYPAYELFSKHYPEQEQNMRKALQYAVDPIDDIIENLAFLDNFGGWMLKEVDHYLNNRERNKT